MSVRIVCRDYDSEKILPRKARHLAEGNGWSLGDRPDPGAEINYYFCYIEYAERFTDWRKKTLTAAYFTHLETGTGFKENFWRISSEQVNIRLCSSAKYSAILPTPVYRVRPPVDPAFTILERDKNTHFVIGVSGFVDRSGRKGEKLVKRLSGDMKGSVDIIASGQGWPVPTTLHPLSYLPTWYNSLDLFLCTSSIEGVPMPPLEALACGVPVVIPRDVGLLDDLPDTAGIYRYDNRDYDNLLSVVRQAMDERHDREALRQAVSEYTPERWCADHAKAFIKATKKQASEPVKTKQAQRKKVVKTPKMNGDKLTDRGVYYVAFGDPARECAEAAIQSFHKYLPEYPVALCSDKPLGCEDVFVQHPDQDIGGRAAKVKIYDLAPAEWQYVAYLDADTEIIERETFLWDIVADGWDMTICKNPARFHVIKHMVRPDNRDECEETFKLIGTDNVMQLNGGVFAFRRNDRTAAFFHAWYMEWLKYKKRDQAALLRALWANPVKLYLLGNEWNTVTRYDSPETAAWLLHYPTLARRWSGVLHPATDTKEAWAAVDKFMRERGKA